MQISYFNLLLRNRLVMLFIILFPAPVCSQVYKITVGLEKDAAVKSMEAAESILKSLNFVRGVQFEQKSNSYILIPRNNSVISLTGISAALKKSGVKIISCVVDVNMARISQAGKNCLFYGGINFIVLGKGEEQFIGKLRLQIIARDFLSRQHYIAFSETEKQQHKCDSTLSRESHYVVVQKTH